MKVDDLVDMIRRAYGEQTDKGLFFGLMTGRDVCVSSEGPFEVELIGVTELPAMHGSKEYVRYHVSRRTVPSNGRVPLNAQQLASAERRALEQAATWFEEYAADHAKKAGQASDSYEQGVRREKAKRNAERAAFLRAALAAGVAAEQSFQQRVKPFMMGCFGEKISADRLERCDRFLEESLETVQAGGYSRDRAHALVDYTFDRPVGELFQEVGGASVTLAALCLAFDIDMHAAAETELARILRPEIMEKIRAKQAAKPVGSALPIPLPPAPAEEAAA